MGRKRFKFAALLISILFTIFACSKDNVKTPDPDPEPSVNIEFVTIPTDGATPEFQMSVTEISYQQYVDFLNEAFAKAVISYNSSDQTVLDKNGNIMTSLNGSRVVKDHNHNDEYEIEDMENPLNINFIRFNESDQVFEIEEPALVDWDRYFDPQLYPNVVDSKEDWFEVGNNSEGFYDSKWDADGLMPTLEEIKTWPANFIRYFGAHAFAEYYGYDLPTKNQWYTDAKGGQDFDYATYNGEGNTDVAVIGSCVP